MIPAGVHGDEARPLLHEPADVLGVEARPRPCPGERASQDALRVHLPGQRQLHQDAVDLGAPLYCVDRREHLGGRRARRQPPRLVEEPELLAARASCSARRRPRPDRRRPGAPRGPGAYPAPRAPASRRAAPPGSAARRPSPSSRRAVIARILHRPSGQAAAPRPRSATSRTARGPARTSGRSSASTPRIRPLSPGTTRSSTRRRSSARPAPGSSARTSQRSATSGTSGAMKCAEPAHLEARAPAACRPSSARAVAPAVVGDLVHLVEEERVGRHGQHQDPARARGLEQMCRRVPTSSSMCSSTSNRLSEVVAGAERRKPSLVDEHAAAPRPARRTSARLSGYTSHAPASATPLSPEECEQPAGPAAEVEQRRGARGPGRRRAARRAPPARRLANQ